ncbi:M20/M25/M40 family metallo-hydrolase [Isosphaeraceae bacterium EP7]
MDAQAFAAAIRPFIRPDRLVDTARRLVAVPSRTAEAGPAADMLAQILAEDGFEVERPVADHPASPAVVVRFSASKPGRTLQFDGHIDVVHLPYVAPTLEGDLLKGSGSCDMKGGLAAAVEALRAVRDSGLLAAGGILLTAHDHHEAPWGDGRQFDRLIRDGIVGDAVLIPEPLFDRLPTAGRGAATWTVTFRREGIPVHEVMRPAGQPSVIAAGARLVELAWELNDRLSAKSDPVAGAESVFVGQIHAGEIYNQAPVSCFVEGTRRWLPGTSREHVETEFRALIAEVETKTGTTADVQFRFIRDAFRLNLDHPFVSVFRDAYRETSPGNVGLPDGPKPFVDDGNSVYALAGVPAITHGPRAGGQHTVDEWVSVEDLVRVANLYATAALVFCQ